MSCETSQQTGNSIKTRCIWSYNLQVLEVNIMFDICMAHKYIMHTKKSFKHLQSKFNNYKQVNHTSIPQKLCNTAHQSLRINNAKKKVCILHSLSKVSHLQFSHEQRKQVLQELMFFMNKKKILRISC